MTIVPDWALIALWQMALIEGISFCLIFHFTQPGLAEGRQFGKDKIQVNMDYITKQLPLY